MNRFAGKMCPYCKSEILEDDDIVVCSECEMPHHKDCWVENEGCTTFGCSGTIQSSGSSQELPPASGAGGFEFEMYPSGSAVYCPKCGIKHEPSDMFCRNCGYCFSGFSAPQNTALPSTYAGEGASGSAAFNQKSQSSLEGDLIGPNAEYYFGKFSDMSYRSKSNCWNWASFLFSIYWCVYRKMYGIGAAVFAGLFIFSLFGIVGIMLALVGRIVFGVYANYLYMSRITRLMSEFGSLTDEASRAQFVSNKGGVNVVATVLCVVVYVILYIISYLN